MQRYNESPPLFALSVEDFRELNKSIIEEVAKTLSKSLKSEVSRDTGEPYLNFAQAAAYLGISKPTFSKLRKQGKIACYKVSQNRVLFAKSDLERYLNEEKAY